MKETSKAGASASPKAGTSASPKPATNESGGPPPPTYTEAFSELQTIISEIEGGAISVDKLAEKVKRAAILIRICQDKLKATEGDVNQIFDELESSDTMDTRSGRDRVADAGDAAGD